MGHQQLTLLAAEGMSASIQKGEMDSAPQHPSQGG